jgi:hypothetical protein
VSYLGFDEIYHQLYAEFPNYATLNDAEIRGRAKFLATGLSPSLVEISISLCQEAKKRPTNHTIQRCNGKQS